MARKSMVEVKCDRCERVEYVDAAQAEKEKVLDLELKDGVSKKPARKVFFNDLCDPCYQTIIKYVDQIAKKVAGKSPSRSETKEKASPKTGLASAHAVSDG